ncbi:pyroglutamyl-peptidase I [Staphylococcus roterodami]|nr:pyroglutamyl-peptidase I [Staphylococcus roterodami]UMT80682.1 pyroglutamyl-peptidase I [Staphylococcus roterodami]
MHILVTGFAPFDNQDINPSWEAVTQLEDYIGDHTIDKLKLPTSFKKVDTMINKALASNHYDVVLSIGQAGGRSAITPERVAINIDDARIPDNDDFQPIDQAIHLDGASAYFSNLPVKAMTKSIIDQGLPGALSNSAGTYVCNHVLYHLGYLQDKHYPHLRFGFIHVPYIPEQIGGKPDTPSMTLENIVTGLTAAIEAISDDDDLRIALGTTE